MTLTPLLAAPAPIILHAVAALAAFVLGAVQLAGPKGTRTHRTLGWAWAALMAAVAASSFAISTIRQFGRFSAIHLLSIFVLVVLPVALWSAHRHRAAAHGRAMTLLFIGALVIAGAFTLYPGRIMHRVVFGG
jgi:uncharacterized membrane protein